MPQGQRPPVHELDRFQRGQRTRRAFNATFKRETLQGRKNWPSEHEAHLDAFRWLHRYNTRRRHSRLGQRSPITYETAFRTTSTTLSPAALPRAQDPGSRPVSNVPAPTHQAPAARDPTTPTRPSARPESARSCCRAS
ncbi:integrase core domain-containing protein [Streptomyces atratus]|uniref:integrase core domain-containing protein n=1 Tax=Streptomyces atratus TaxID=1893 RepID=UPI003863D98B